MSYITKITSTQVARSCSKRKLCTESIVIRTFSSSSIQTINSNNIEQEQKVISCAGIFASLASNSNSSSNKWRNNVENSIIGKGNTTTKATFSNSKSSKYSDTLKELESLAKQKPTPLSLSTMYKFAGSIDKKQRLRNAQFLHRELPIRFAHRAYELLTLPCGLSKVKPIREVANEYHTIMKQLRSFPYPTTQEQEREYTRLLQKVIMNRTHTPHAISRGVQSLQDDRREPIDATKLNEVEEALYRFFTSRVGLRLLMEHHVLSSADDSQSQILRREHNDGESHTHSMSAATRRQHSGAIEKNCDPIGEVTKVVRKVREQCEASFGIAPQIDVIDCSSKTNHELEFCYIPHHLRFMVAELLKNSCRATVNRYFASDKNNQELNSIHVIIVKGQEDVVIKISDRGGGVSRSKLDDIWTFAKSTFDHHQHPQHFVSDDFNSGNDIREFGLPLVRIYARYFGGELILKSMEGVGFDAYLYLPILGSCGENLPLSVATSPGNLDSNVRLSLELDTAERDQH